MYGFIWRHLPGPLVVRILLALVLVAAVVAVSTTIASPSLIVAISLNGLP